MRTVSHPIIITIFLIPGLLPSFSSLTHTLLPNKLLEPLQALQCAHRTFVQAKPHAGMPLPSLLSKSHTSFQVQLKGLLLREALLGVDGCLPCTLLL